MEPRAIGTVMWLSPSDGGRDRPPAGPIYSATAVVRRDESDYEPDDHFSVVMKFASSPTPGVPHAVELDFLAAELVLPTLEAGDELLVMEGSRAVAVCRVESIRDL